MMEAFSSFRLILLTSSAGVWPDLPLVRWKDTLPGIGNAKNLTVLHAAALFFSPAQGK